MASSSAITPLERFLQETKEEIVRTWKEDVTKLTRRLDALEPTSRLPPTLSPVRGKDFVREPNVSALMRSAIEYQNALIPDGNKKYIQFPVGSSDKKINSDAKDALEMIMIDKLGKNYGSLSWSTASKTTHFAQCEAVILTAAASRDFLVFRQSSNLWRIRWLAEQKMKSKGRPSKPRKRNTDVNARLRGPCADKTREVSNATRNETGSRTTTRETPLIAETNSVQADPYISYCNQRMNTTRGSTSKKVGLARPCEEGVAILDSETPAPSRQVHMRRGHTGGSSSPHDATKIVHFLPSNSSSEQMGPQTKYAAQEQNPILLRLRVRRPGGSALPETLIEHQSVPLTLQHDGPYTRRNDISTTVTAPCRDHRYSGLAACDPRKKLRSHMKGAVGIQVPIQKGARRSEDRGRGSGERKGGGRGRGRGRARERGRGGERGVMESVAANDIGRKGSKGMKTVIVRTKRAGLGALRQS